MGEKTSKEIPKAFLSGPEGMNLNLSENNESCENIETYNSSFSSNANQVEDKIDEMPF